MKKTGLMSKITDSKMTGIFLLFFLSVFIVLSIWFYHKLNQSQKRHYSSYVAADELRQSSDDLTRMARTYVVTKDSRYEKMYWDILAIRNGEKARPVRYENIYWDFVAFTNERPRHDGEKISLLKIMENLEFTKEEFELLAKAQMHSNSLVKTEMIAMHAMRGEFLDTQGEFTIRGEQDYEYARTLLHDEAYHSKKVDIMTPIDEFFVRVNTRTEAQVNKDKIYTYIFISLVCMTIILLLWLWKSEMNKLKQTEKERECIIAELKNKSRELEKEIEEHKRDEEKLKASNQQLRAGEQQLRASNQQLLASEQQLKASNQQLKANEQQLQSEITERKKTAEKLLHAVEEWRATFDSSSELISIHTVDYKLIRVNKAFADAVKTHPEELVGSPCFEALHGTTEPRPDCPHTQVVKTGKPARREYFESHLGIYVEASVSPIFDKKGKLIATVHVVTNITERKKMEEETKKHLHDLEVFYNASFGREKRIVELKKRIKKFEKKPGKKTG